MFQMHDQNLMLQRMRDELTENGFEELRTPQAVDAAFGAMPETAVLMFNSVCGCAAGAARPGVVLSLQGGFKPDKLYSCFAGQDRDAAAAARTHLGKLPASSPSVVLLRDGEPVFMLHRHDIEGHDPHEVAAKLTAAYAQHLA